jgi:hypothetical protein
VTSPAASPLGALAAIGLPGAPTVPSCADCAPDDWDALLERITDERITGLVVDGAARGDVHLRDDQYEELLVAHEGAMVATVRLESLLLVVHQLLGARDLDMRVLKGPSCAYLDYDEREQRSFVDIDALVRGKQFDAVAKCLADAGFRRRFDEPRPGFTARFGKGVCFTAANGLELDVHRALTSGPFAVAGDTSVLWQRADSFTIAGTTLTCLAREERAVAAAVHACLGSATPRLVPLRDVAQILTRGVDEARVVDVATQLGVAAVLARAVLLARNTLGLDVPLPCEPWALGYRPSAHERRMLRAYTGADRTYAGQMLAGAREVKGFGARVAYVRALAFPARGYLDDRDSSYRERARRAVRLLSHRERALHE